MKKLFIFAVFVALILTYQISMADEYSITLAWTAVGDDTTSSGEYIGTCKEYDLRYAVNDTIDLCNSSGWWDCQRIEGLPAPKEVGQHEEYSFTLGNFNHGDTLYFAIRAIDEAGNYSRHWNIARKIVKDGVLPGDVDDLEVTVIVKVIIQR